MMILWGPNPPAFRYRYDTQPARSATARLRIGRE